MEYKLKIKLELSCNETSNSVGEKSVNLIKHEDVPFFPVAGMELRLRKIEHEYEELDIFPLDHTIRIENVCFDLDTGLFEVQCYDIYEPIESLLTASKIFIQNYGFGLSASDSVDWEDDIDLDNK